MHKNYKYLQKSNKELKGKKRKLEEKVNDKDYIIEELSKSNDALLYEIEEIKKRKYDMILYSKIPGFGPGKYDKMQKYGNNIKYRNNINALINKKPLNQKRKRGLFK